MGAGDLGNGCLGVAGRNECFNLVPLLQGELIILLCHVVITKVVFGSTLMGLRLASATPPLHYGP